MTTNRDRHIRSETPAGRRFSAWPLVAVISLLAGLTGACSEDAKEPFKDFVGIWEIDFNNSSFPLNCPDPNTDSSGEVALWDRVVIEEGTLTDLIETSGSCPMKMNVKAGIAIAEVANPDPFTGAAPVCRLNASDPPGAIFADVRPSWEFRVLKPVKGEAPRAQLLPLTTAPTLTFVTVAADGSETPDPACTYIVRMELTKVAQF